MRTHGESGTRLNNIWYAMKARCYYTKRKEYENYGGKGIRVCDEWRNNYSNFRDWALKNGYSDELTLDRIDVNGNYEPSNCRWCTQKQQANNTTKNVIVEYNGEYFTISELAEYAKIPMNTLWARIRRLGWSVYDAVNTPVRSLTNNKN